MRPGEGHEEAQALGERTRTGDSLFELAQHGGVVADVPIECRIRNLEIASLDGRCRTQGDVGGQHSIEGIGHLLVEVVRVLVAALKVSRAETVELLRRPEIGGVRAQKGQLAYHAEGHGALDAQGVLLYPRNLTIAHVDAESGSNKRQRALRAARGDDVAIG